MRECDCLTRDDARSLLLAEMVQAAGAEFWDLEAATNRLPSTSPDRRFPSTPQHHVASVASVASEMAKADPDAQPPTTGLRSFTHAFTQMATKALNNYVFVRRSHELLPTPSNAFARRKGTHHGAWGEEEAMKSSDVCKEPRSGYRYRSADLLPRQVRREDLCPSRRLRALFIPKASISVRRRAKYIDRRTEPFHLLCMNVGGRPQRPLNPFIIDYENEISTVRITKMPHPHMRCDLCLSIRGVTRSPRLCAVI